MRNTPRFVKAQIIQRIGNRILEVQLGTRRRKVHVHQLRRHTFDEFRENVSAPKIGETHLNSVVRPATECQLNILIVQGTNNSFFTEGRLNVRNDF